MIAQGVPSQPYLHRTRPCNGRPAYSCLVSCQSARPAPPAALKKSTAASAATAAQEDSEDGDDEPTAAAGAPTANPHPTSRYWRVGVLLPPPTNEFKQLAAAQQLPPRPYDRVKWPQRYVGAHGCNL